MKCQNSIMPENYEEFISLTEDKEFKEAIKNARKKLETPVAPAMPCKTSKNSQHVVTGGKSNETKSKHACILEASESTRLRVGNSSSESLHKAGTSGSSRCPSQTVLRSERHLLMDEVVQLTKNKTGRQVLAEIGVHGRSELTATCEALRGKALRISRETGCDLLTRDANAGETHMLGAHCPTVRFILECVFVLVPVAMDRQNRHLRLRHRLQEGRRLIRAALKLTAQALNPGGLNVWEWPRACLAWQFPDTQQRQGSLELDSSSRR